ncbi:MAG: hypothetical protein ACRDUV_00615 [Pseudonocardiaceae bacterium]
MFPLDDPLLMRLSSAARALAGPLPGGRYGLAPTLGPELAAAAAGEDVELAVAVLRPAAMPPTLVDAIVGSRLLSLTGDTGSDACPVAVVGSPGCAVPMLTLHAYQRRALERLDGLGGRGGRTVAPTYRGASEVAGFARWARQVVASAGARWPHSAAVLRSEPLRVTVPGFLPESAVTARIALLDVTALDQQGERVHAAIIVLDYRDLVGSAQQAAQLSGAARGYYASVGTDRFVVVVDGIERSHSGNPGNLRHTVWRRASAALRMDLAPASVLSVSSVLALSSTTTSTASARDILRGVDDYEQSQVGAVLQALRTLRDRAGEVIAATVIRRLQAERELPDVPNSSDGGFTDEDVASSWAQLYATACLPLITSTLDRFDADFAEH